MTKKHLYGIFYTEMKIHIEVSPETKFEIDEIRTVEGLSLNWLVNRAIRNYLKLKKQSADYHGKKNKNN